MPMPRIYEQIKDNTVNPILKNATLEIVLTGYRNGIAYEVNDGHRVKFINDRRVGTMKPIRYFGKIKDLRKFLERLEAQDERCAVQ